MADYISVTDTAKIVRGELKKHFPGVVFSVRSSSYSMGASIDMEWLDGPTKSEVEVITDEFEGSTFDGMTDMKSNRYSTWQGREVSWGADSVSTVRRYSKSFYSQVVDQVCQKHGVPTPEIMQDSYTYKGKTSYGNPYIADNNIQIGCDDLSTLIRRELDKTSAYTKPTEPGAIAVASNADDIAVTVTENTEKNGIEISFSSKPPDDVIESLREKSRGFKYHRAKNKWYAKKTNDRVNFATKLAARFNQPQQSDQPVPLEGYNNLNDCLDLLIDICDRLTVHKIHNPDRQIDNMTEPELEGLSDLEIQRLQHRQKLDQECEQKQEVKNSEQYIPTEEEVYQSWKNKIKKLATNKAELYFQSQPQELLQSAYRCHKSEVLRLLKQHYKTLLIFKSEFPSGVIICDVPTWNIAVSCYLSYTLLWDSLIKEILDTKISKTNESVNTEIV